MTVGEQVTGKTGMRAGRGERVPRPPIPPRSPSNPPAASGGALCEGNRQELQACHVECGTGRSGARMGACYSPPQPSCLPSSSQFLPWGQGMTDWAAGHLHGVSVAFWSRRQPQKAP